MEFDRDEVRKINQQLTAGGTAPPRLILHATAALIQGREVRRIVASHQPLNLPAVANEEAQGVGTLWRVLALLDGGLASIVGRSAHADELEGDLTACFIPLSEVTGCAMMQMLHQPSFGSPDSLYACRTRWSLTVRDGSSLEIPWREAGDALDPHEAFAHDLIDLLSTRPTIFD